jgi:hypothetical protein
VHRALRPLLRKGGGAAEQQQAAQRQGSQHDISPRVFLMISAQALAGRLPEPTLVSACLLQSIILCSK